MTFTSSGLTFAAFLIALVIAPTPPSAQPGFKFTISANLEVEESSGDVGGWVRERVINLPVPIRFRWSTQRSDLLSATWYLTATNPLQPGSTPPTSGDAGMAPAPGAVRFFNVDLRPLLSPNAPANPITYWVTLRIEVAGGGVVQSMPVKITYVQQSGQTTVFTPEGLGESIRPLVEGVRARYGLPGIGAAIVTRDGVRQVTVSGKRRHDDVVNVFPTDRWHLGSCTKAMTATLIGRMVDRGVIEWTTTIAETFPELRDVMNQAQRDITVADLLRHRAGFSGEGYNSYESDVLSHRDMSNRARRYVYAKDLLLRAPGPNVYSNRGYIVAAAMLERRANRQWEDMMREELFGPLGMQSAGFGPPETEVPGLHPDQPWGHQYSGPQRTASAADNPPGAGPAGNVHVSLRDWGRFIRLHLNGREGKLQLNDRTLSELHTRINDYAGGWAADSNGILSHNGSNNWWYANAYVDTIRGFGILTTTNIGGDGARRALGELTGKLVEYQLGALTLKLTAAAPEVPRGESLSSGVTLTLGTAAVSGTTITFGIRKPNNAVMTRTVSTDALGKATLVIAADVQGVWTIRATATVGGQTANASINITVV